MTNNLPVTLYDDCHNLMQYCPEEFKLEHTSIQHPHYQYSKLIEGRREGKVVIIKTWLLNSSVGRADSGPRMLFTEVLSAGLKNWMKVSHHQNVANIVGVVDKFLVLPSLVMVKYENGNILDYLKMYPSNDIATHLLCGASRALHFMHSQTPPIIHGRLKASNILINHVGEPCLTDIDLERVWDLSGHVTSDRKADSEDYRGRSPQALRNSTLSTADDAYRFGMTMLEARRHCLSWPNLTDINHISYCKSTALFVGASSGKYLEPPRKDHYPDVSIPDEIWGLMERCWVYEPDHRPLMQDVMTEFENLSKNIWYRH
ncbi:kinase-like domain-containing protein [Cyathus striatus]|nr:kinase-like domain-containing protein [Cyathus striatus]